MSLSYPAAFAALGLLLKLSCPPAIAQILVPSFGECGQVTLGYSAVANNDDDFALEACATPAGTLTVYGSASGNYRILTARLRADGELDTSSSGDGKESFDWPGQRMFDRERVGLCLADGDAVLAQPALEAGDERIVLVRIDALTGLPDPGWGSAALAVIDMDGLSAELGQRESPLGLNLSADGGVDLNADVALPNSGSRGFLVRLGPTDLVRATTIAPQQSCAGISSPDLRSPQRLKARMQPFAAHDSALPLQAPHWSDLLAALAFAAADISDLPPSLAARRAKQGRTAAAQVRTKKRRDTAISTVRALSPA